MKKLLTFKKQDTNKENAIGLYWIWLGVLCITLSLSGCETLKSGNLSKTLSAVGGDSSGALSTQQVVAGLKEALQVGTEKAVKQASSKGGFSENPATSIPLPEKLKPMTDGLRKVGLGGKVDEVKAKMNRAAELAAAKAAPVFIKAIKDMSFTDAKRILKGNATAATDYFRSETSGELEKRFTPIVKEKMNQLGVVRLFENLQNRYNQLPMVKDSDFQIKDYVVNKTLDGLFTVLGNEEEKIRQDPKARTTKLLRNVFGR